jgi:hypothetical protein
VAPGQCILDQPAGRLGIAQVVLDAGEERGQLYSLGIATRRQQVEGATQDRQAEMVFDQWEAAEAHLRRGIRVCRTTRQASPVCDG